MQEPRRAEKTGKYSHFTRHRSSISIMQYVHAHNDRVVRYAEGLSGLVSSRGRAMTPAMPTQSFAWAKTDAQEVPSTA